MKIWLDITNAPHVIFFFPFIKKWNTLSYHITITTRDYSNTIDLLKKHNLEYNIVGKHGGKNIFFKIFNFIDRVFSLVIFLRKRKIDVSLSHSSFYQPLASKLIGVPSIYLNDNEHAYGNYFSFPFASKILLPEALENYFKFFKNKINYYKGVKEGIYLSQMDFTSKTPSAVIKNVIYRPGPWLAQYHDSRVNNDIELLKFLKKKYELTLLPRDKKQYDYYKSLNISINVVEGVLSLNDIYLKSDLFVGSGGTMTRELAVLGIPSVNNYSGKMLKVDEYLEKRGLFIKDIMKIDPTLIKNLKLYEYGKDSFKLINLTLNEYKKS